MAESSELSTRLSELRERQLEIDIRQAHIISWVIVVLSVIAFLIGLGFVVVVWRIGLTIQ